MAFFGKTLQNPIVQLKRESVPVKSSSLSIPAPSRSAIASKASRRLVSRSEPVSKASKATANGGDRELLQPRKRRRTNRTTPSHSSTPFDEDSSDDDEEPDAKRSRSTSAIPRSTDGDESIDFKRRLRAKNNPSEKNGGTFSVVHAADVASLGQDKFVPALGASREDDLKVRLYYPGASQPERYLALQKLSVSMC